MHIENISLQSLARSNRGVSVTDLREALEGRSIWFAIGKEWGSTELQAISEKALASLPPSSFPLDSQAAEIGIYHPPQNPIPVSSIDSIPRWSGVDTKAVLSVLASDSGVQEDKARNIPLDPMNNLSPLIQRKNLLTPNCTPNALDEYEPNPYRALLTTPPPSSS
ncbi:hypothetical protein EV359DRAFT_86464 [Lentinula novae-zelandiae]|nr:hypothetical protein EV359DRAFT_86464 [Lentinula novae-zelandiae]